MEKIVKEREILRDEAVLKVRKFGGCIKNYYKVHKLILVGSYARGDFDAWSDIDVLVVVDDDIDKNPLTRLDKIIECMKRYPDIEPIILTSEEYIKLRTKRNPLIIEAEKIGIIIEA